MNSETSATHRRRFLDGSHRTEVPRLRRDVRGGGALRVHPLLRARGGRLRPRGACGGPGGAAAPHPGRAAEPVALRRPAAGGRPGDRGPLPPGLTPLVRADRLAERLGLGEVWVKNDTANPTHSFKDRVVSVALAKAR